MFVPLVSTSSHCFRMLLHCIFITPCLFVLTVRWHAVALCVVRVRCVWSCRLEGRAVLSLSICCHDNDPGEGRKKKMRELLLASLTSLYPFHCFVMLKFSMGKNGWLPGIFDKIERYALFCCFGLFASSAIKSLKT